MNPTKKCRGRTPAHMSSAVMQMDPTTFKANILIARGLGILTVVLGHIHMPIPVLSAQSFHMPMFFLIGGIMLDLNHTIRGTVYHVTKGMLLFAIAMAIFYSSIAFAIKPLWGVSYQTFDGISVWNYTTALVTDNAHNVKLALTNWFLITYGICAVLVLAVAKLASAVRIGNAILVVIALISGYAGVELLGASKGVHGDWPRLLASHVLVAGSLFLAGYLGKRSGLLEKGLSSPIVFVAAVALLGYSLSALQPRTPIMSWSKYPSGALAFYSVALTASFAVLYVAFNVTHELLVKALIYLGRNSKHVMAHHLFGFAIVNLSLVSAGVLKASKVGAIYTWHPGLMWPIYAASGIGVSLVLMTLWSRLGTLWEGFHKDIKLHPSGNTAKR